MIVHQKQKPQLQYDLNVYLDGLLCFYYIRYVFKLFVKTILQAERLVKSFKKLFRESKVMHAFWIVDPNSLPSLERKCSQFGNREVELLERRYVSHSNNMTCINQKYVLNFQINKYE